jgi:hypothetical protein
MDKNEHLPRCVYAVGKRFLARVRVSGKRQSLGTFDTVAEASAAVEGFLKPIHGAFYRNQSKGFVPDVDNDQSADIASIRA